MGRIISVLIMRLFGWRYEGEAPKEKKYVVISVPHTSKLDFVWGKFAFSSKGVKPIIFIKKEAFKFPLGILLKWLGAKPVNRGRGAIGLVEQIIHHFNKNDEFIVCITPEGTRDLRKKWKRGFYFIAQQAKVPIYLGYVDYNKKVCSIGQRFEPTGDINTDMKQIRDYYIELNPQPKHSEKFTFDFT